MKVFLRRMVVLVALIAATLGVTITASPTASANTLTRGRLWHSWSSHKKEIRTSSKYNGWGLRGTVERGHRPSGDQKVKSILVPKGCTLYVNGWSYNRAWTKDEWANIGKSNYLHATVSMACWGPFN